MLKQNFQNPLTPNPSVRMHMLCKYAHFNAYIDIIDCAIMYI